jgi:hypothetical protein
MAKLNSAVGVIAITPQVFLLRIDVAAQNESS